MLPVSCWEQIAQAAGAVSASRLTCTASSLAAAQQYGTRERHEAEIKLFAMATAGEMKEPRKKWMLDPAISVPDLVGVLENYMRSQKTRELGKLLERAMGGHESTRKVPKYESLFFVTSLCKNSQS